MSTSQELVGNVDLAPTFLAIAGVSPTAPMDGKSMLPLLTRGCAPRAADGPRDTGVWRSEFPIEYFPVSDWPRSMPPKKRLDDSPNNSFRALRIVNTTHSMLFSEHTQLSDWEFEAPYLHQLFDLRDDPAQMTNLFDKIPGAEQARLRRRLESVWQCEGSTCL